MQSPKEKQLTKLEKLLPMIRRGTYAIVQARLGCHYQSITAVIKHKKYWNDDIVKQVEQVNKLSDEDFAVELVRAKRKINLIQEQKKSQNTNKNG